MSTEVAPTGDLGVDADTDRRLTLHARFLRAAFADTSLLRDIPNDVLLVLLPDDDDAYVEREVARAARSARRGDNVYLRHVHVADLPELPTEPTAPPAGLRRTFFEWDGSIASQEIRGADGEWHPVEPPEPVDE
jgi:hypothetical protein